MIQSRHVSLVFLLTTRTAELDLRLTEGRYLGAEHTGQYNY